VQPCRDGVAPRSSCPDATEYTHTPAYFPYILPSSTFYFNDSWLCELLDFQEVDIAALPLVQLEILTRVVVLLKNHSYRS
jgi:hypothetical protein